MKKLLMPLLALVGGNAFSQAVTWPPLPKDGYVIGRPATKADVEQGNAVFVAESSGIKIGKPVAITIPQYAWHVVEGKRIPAIIVQGEDANGMKIVGARYLSGQLVAGLMEEFVLLGVQQPQPK